MPITNIHKQMRFLLPKVWALLTSGFSGFTNSCPLHCAKTVHLSWNHRDADPSLWFQDITKISASVSVYVHIYDMRMHLDVLMYLYISILTDSLICWYFVDILMMPLDWNHYVHSMNFNQSRKATILQRPWICNWNSKNSKKYTTIPASQSVPSHHWPLLRGAQKTSAENQKLKASTSSA